MKVKSIILMIVLVVGSDSAISATLYCKGKISKVFVRENGDLLVYSDWREDYSKICNLDGTEPSTIVCSMWASYAAQAVDKQLTVLHSLQVNNGATCSETETYGNTPKTLYFMLLNEQ